MSRPVISTLPSCMSFGWTNLMSSSMSSSFRSAAQTSPSKSLRVQAFTRPGSLPHVDDRVRVPIGAAPVSLEHVGAGKLDTADSFDRIFSLYGHQFVVL